MLTTKFLNKKGRVQVKRIWNIYCTGSAKKLRFFIRCYRKTWTNFLANPITNYMCVLSHFGHIWPFATLWTVASQAPLSMRFSRQQYQGGLPCPLPGDLPGPGIESTSPALAGGLFTTCATWEAINDVTTSRNLFLWWELLRLTLLTVFKYILKYY